MFKETVLYQHFSIDEITSFIQITVMKSARIEIIIQFYWFVVVQPPYLRKHPFLYWLMLQTLLLLPKFDQVIGLFKS